MQTRNEKLRGYAQSLRKNMTKEERRLWYDFLHTLQPKFYRQHVINNYILDFYCPQKKIAIEIDGSQHYTYEGEEADKNRDNYLQTLGIKVLRFSNLQINQQFKAVCEEIYNHCN